MFTWEELVALGLINIFNDPELVISFLKVLKPLRRDHVEDEARFWHTSLRITKEDRWKNSDQLKKEKKFSCMNSSVPITCTLPFDGEMWRSSCSLLKSIRYFQKHFIRETLHDVLDIYPIHSDQYLPDKIKTVNYILDGRGQLFKNFDSILDIREALLDFELFNCESEEEIEDPYIEPVYILIDKQKISDSWTETVEIIG
jgi:hypothetical protein